MGWALPPRPCGVRDVSSIITPGCVQPAPRSLEVFRPQAPAPSRARATLAELRLLQSMTIGRHHAWGPLSRRSSCVVPPWASCPFSAIGPGKPRSIHRAFHARLRYASRVSHPPGGLTPPRAPPACFIRLALLGFAPSELFSSLAAVAPLGARCRPAVHHRLASRDPPRTIHPPGPWSGRACFALRGPRRSRRSASRPCSTSESVAAPGAV
jgi:hypothetical protein